MTKLYIVAPVNLDYYGNRHMVGYGNVLSLPKSPSLLDHMVGIFETEMEAKNCAFGCASKNGGIEMGVFECVFQYIIPTSAPVEKVWNGTELTLRK